MLLGTFDDLTRVLHALSLFFIAVLSVFAISYTLMCAVGAAPWFSLRATFGDTTFVNAGFYVQLAVTALIGALVFLVPSNARILTLEKSHRDFHIRMEDVAQAYHLVHTADRSGLFTLSSEFDAVRERLAYMRDHPDLERLEPGVMDVAAQMSQQARHLADVYSDKKVARARDFLRQRQQDAERQQERITEALHICTEIRKWAQQVEMEESIVASQLAQLDEQLQAALPGLGYSLEHVAADEDDKQQSKASKKDADARKSTKSTKSKAKAAKDDDNDMKNILIAPPAAQNVVNMAQKPAAE